MKTRLLTICLFAAFAFISCDSLEKVSGEGYPIFVSATAEENLGSSPSTRVPYTATTPSSDNPLGALVLLSTTDGEYANTDADGTDASGGAIAVHTNATFTSGEEQLLNGALYNSNADKQPMVYFSALSPAADWTITGTQGSKNYKATRTFNGSEDLMFAPQVDGKYNGTTPQLTFKHLLTWIKLHMYAESEEVALAWGKINSITITNAADMGNMADAVEVNLSQPLVNNLPNATYPPKAGTSMKFYSTGGNDVFPASSGYGLEYPASKEVAYVMVAPVVAQDKDAHDASLAVDEFVIDIKAENRSASVNVDLMKSASEFFTGSTMGYQFSLTLKFTLGNTIAVQAAVTDWETGGIGIGDVTE